MGGALGSNCPSWCQSSDVEDDSPALVEFEGGLVNKAGVKVRWATLLEAFEFCDPENTSFISEKYKAKFGEVAKECANDNRKLDQVWHGLDQDGNGAVGFPEFCEWAERKNVPLEVGLPDIGDGGHGGVCLPDMWTGDPSDNKRNERVDINEQAQLDELQEMLNVSYKKVWTRDRKATGRNEVPKQFILVKAQRNENYADWKRYYLRRHMIAHKCSSARNFRQYQARTNTASKQLERSRIRTNCNEWLLFHGTNETAAQNICSGTTADFLVSKAGSATGTLYGRGTYFADSCTKADEYAKEGEGGLSCMLVCRIVGGRVRYTDEVSPNAQDLQDSVTLRGECDCVLGDREKCRNTFKEYVIFDGDQVYVEYILFYKRIY